MVASISSIWSSGHLAWSKRENTVRRSCSLLATGLLLHVIVQAMDFRQHVFWPRFHFKLCDFTRSIIDDAQRRNSVVMFRSITSANNTFSCAVGNLLSGDDILASCAHATSLAIGKRCGSRRFEEPYDERIIDGLREAC
jgi:hypothetical protein